VVDALLHPVCDSSLIGFLSVLQIYVFFPEDAKVGVKTIKNYTNIMKSENVPRAILVVQQNLTPFAKTCISEISSKFHLEVFQVNIDLHYFINCDCFLDLSVQRANLQVANRYEKPCCKLLQQMHLSVN